MLGTGLGPAYGEVLQPSHVDWRSETPIAVMPTVVDVRRCHGCPAKYGDHAQRLLSELKLEKFADYFASVAGSVYLDPQILFDAEGIGKLVYLRFRVWAQATAPFDVLVGLLLHKQDERVIIDVRTDGSGGPDDYGGAAAAALALLARGGETFDGEMGAVVQLKPDVAAAIRYAEGQDEADGEDTLVQGEGTDPTAFEMLDADDVIGTDIGVVNFGGAGNVTLNVDNDGGVDINGINPGGLDITVVDDGIDGMGDGNARAIAIDDTIGDGDERAGDADARGVYCRDKVVTDARVRIATIKRFIVERRAFETKNFYIAGLRFFIASIDACALLRAKSSSLATPTRVDQAGLIAKLAARLRALPTAKKGPALTRSSSLQHWSSRAFDIFVSYRHANREGDSVREQLRDIALFCDRSSANRPSDPIGAVGEAITRSGGVAVIFLGVLSSAEVEAASGPACGDDGDKDGS